MVMARVGWRPVGLLKLVLYLLLAMGRGWWREGNENSVGAKYVVNPLSSGTSGGKTDMISQPSRLESRSHYSVTPRPHPASRLLVLQPPASRFPVVNEFPTTTHR